MNSKRISSGIPYCPVGQFAEYYVDQNNSKSEAIDRIKGDNRKPFFSIYLRTVNPCKAEIDINRTEFFKILLITKGSGVLQYGTNEYEVRPNCLLFLKPTEVKSWRATTNDQEGFYCIFNELFLATNSFELSELKINPLFTPSSPPVLPLIGDEVLTMHSIFSDLYDEFSATTTFSEDICRLHLKIILLRSRRLLHESFDQSKANVSAATYLAQRFNDILEEEFIKKETGTHLRTPSEYAEKLCVHTNYLNASVKKATGKTTQAIINDRTLQEAQILLKYTQLTTSEIADQLGFKETTHFCSFFKKMASITPLQYRKLNTALHREGVD